MKPSSRDALIRWKVPFVSAERVDKSAIAPSGTLKPNGKWYGYQFNKRDLSIYEIEQFLSLSDLFVAGIKCFRTPYGHVVPFDFDKDYEGEKDNLDGVIDVGNDFLRKHPAGYLGATKSLSGKPHAYYLVSLDAELPGRPNLWFNGKHVGDLFGTEGFLIEPDLDEFARAVLGRIGHVEAMGADEFAGLLRGRGNVVDSVPGTHIDDGSFPLNLDFYDWGPTNNHTSLNLAMWHLAHRVTKDRYSDASEAVYERFLHEKQSNSATSEDEGVIRDEFEATRNGKLRNSDIRWAIPSDVAIDTNVVLEFDIADSVSLRKILDASPMDAYFDVQEDRGYFVIDGERRDVADGGVVTDVLEYVEENCVLKGKRMTYPPQKLKLYVEGYARRTKRNIAQELVDRDLTNPDWTNDEHQLWENLKIRTTDAIRVFDVEQVKPVEMYLDDVLAMIRNVIGDDLMHKVHYLDNYKYTKRNYAEIKGALFVVLHKSTYNVLDGTMWGIRAFDYGIPRTWVPVPYFTTLDMEMLRFT